MYTNISDSDISCDTTSLDSDSSESEVSHSHTEVEESNIPSSRSSIISPKLSNGHKTRTPSSSRSKEESDDGTDDIVVG